MRRIGLLLAVLLVSIGFGLLVSDAQSPFWTEGYEATLSNWIMAQGCTNGVDGCNGHITTDQAQAGTHALRGDYTAPNTLAQAQNVCPGDPNALSSSPFCGDGNCSPGCGTFMDRTHTATRDLWFRSYVRFSSDWWPGTHCSKWFYFKADNAEIIPCTGQGYRLGGTYTPGSGNQMWVNWTVHGPPGGQFTYVCPNGTLDTSCNTYPNGTTSILGGNQWYCIEFHVKLDSTNGAGDGSIQWYTDGTLNASYSGLHLTDHPSYQNSPQGFYYLRNYTQAGYGQRWTDTVSLGTTRIGCGGAPPSPPAAPSQLKGCVAPPCTPITLDNWLRRIWAWVLPSWA